MARVAGNGFAILVPNVHYLEKADVASGIARRLMATIGDAIDVDGQDLFVTSSVGIAVSATDGPDANALLKHAEMAMYQAKRRGGNCSEFFSAEMNRYAKERLTIETQLRRAVERDELTLFYQPKVDIVSGRIAGVEALARWKHPELGFVPPGRFIPIAEETGLIVQLGQWVLRSACTQAQRWVSQGLPPLTLSVNVSSAQFKQGRVWHAVKGALANSGLAAGSLVLELTESMLMDNADESVGMLYELKELGVRLSIDDFGTGYSSLSYLSRFPLDELKIDRSFVRSLTANSQSEAIVGAIIALAKQLKLKVVAEGVEKAEQLRFLRDQSCDEYQGYLFSRPTPATFLANLLRRINTSGTAGSEARLEALYP
jgi:EAL domain-containing protein (putative c-di-GMP-specific phosphodiesterase class I)